MGLNKEYLGTIKASNKFLVVVFLIGGLFLIAQKIGLSKVVDTKKGRLTIQNEKPVIAPEKEPQVFNLDNCLIESIQSFKNEANHIDVGLVTNIFTSHDWARPTYENIIPKKLIARKFKEKKYRVYTKNNLKGCTKQVSSNDYLEGDFTPYFDYLILLHYEIDFKLIDVSNGRESCEQYMKVRVYDTSKKEWIYNEGRSIGKNYTSYAEMDNGFAERNKKYLLSALDNLDFPF